MNLENSTIPTPAPSTKRTRKDMLFPGFLKKELTEEISRSYTPSIIAMEPPLTPGTVMVPPIHIPFNIVIRLSLSILKLLFRYLVHCTLWNTKWELIFCIYYA